MDKHTKYLRIVSISDLPNQVPSRYLTAGELEVFAKIAPNKQECWLVGRFAAKESIKGYYSDLGVEINDLQIEVCNRASGAPYYKLLSSGVIVDNSEYDAYLSISHCQKQAVANCVSKKEVSGLGVDIEEIRDFEVDTIKAFLTEDEFTKFQSVSEENKPQFATLHWSIKEAYLKSLGTGIRTHPKLVSVSLQSESSAEVSLNDSKGAPIANASFATKDGEYVIVSAVLAKY